MANIGFKSIIRNGNDDAGTFAHGQMQFEGGWFKHHGLRGCPPLVNSVEQLLS